MIERHPEGTKQIPYPHKIIHWKRGEPTLTLEADPRNTRRTNPPKIEGWKCFFIGFFGYERPTHYSYRPQG